MKRMTPHRIYNWCSAILLVASGVLLLWPASDAVHSSSQAAAIAEQGEAFRFAKAAREMCGEDAAWDIVGDTIQCYRHTGQPTITAEVMP